MPFDQYPLLTKILIGLMAPPIMTLFCWLIGPRLAGRRRDRPKARNWVEFWLLLIAAYLVFAIALFGRNLFSVSDGADPSSQLVQ